MNLKCRKLWKKLQRYQFNISIQRLIITLYQKLVSEVTLCVVLVNTIKQLHSTKPEFDFCTVSNPARGLSQIYNDQNPWQWFRLEIRLLAFCRSTIPQKQFIIIIIIIIIIMKRGLRSSDYSFIKISKSSKLAFYRIKKYNQILKFLFGFLTFSQLREWYLRHTKLDC